MSNQYGAPDRTPLLGGRTLPSGAGSGFSGTGTLWYSSVVQIGGLIYTDIFVDLTGVNSGGTAADIIGKNATANCHIGQVDPLVCGAIQWGYVQCLETPAGGEPDIDLYSAVEATGTEDAAITALTETALMDAAADWTAATAPKGFSAVPAANEYLYLVQSGGATDATYTAGKFRIHMVGIAS